VSATGPILVQKYGGSSVATPEHLRRVAELIKQRATDGYRVCVVVSAMGDTTDSLLARARELHESPPRRELDMLLTAGERVSMALLAMTLDKLGVPSISFTGSQCGILTSDSHSGARILEVRPYRVQDELDNGRVVIVAGFQGVSYKREVTTLGRGGSDTTAVALAAALGAEACEIYSDVDGVFSADPRVVDDAVQLEALGYEEMQELAAAGARVLNPQAVQFAKAKQIAIYARKTGSGSPGTVIRVDAPPPPGAVRGIAHKRGYTSLRAANLAATHALLDHLDAHGVPSGEIVGREGTGVWLLVPPEDAHAAEACFGALPEGVVNEGVVDAASAVGAGLLADRAVITRGLDALTAAELPVLGLSTSSFRVTFLVPHGRANDAARALHRALVTEQPTAAETP
jgi:aspartate kinase